MKTTVSKISNKLKEMITTFSGRDLENIIAKYLYLRFDISPTDILLEKEINYLLALNPRLKEISENDLSKLAKRSMIKEIIRKSEILKYKELDLKNNQINNVLESIIQNLNFSDQSEFENYLRNFDTFQKFS